MAKREALAITVCAGLAINGCSGATSSVGSTPSDAAVHDRGSPEDAVATAEVGSEDAGDSKVDGSPGPAVDASGPAADAEGPADPCPAPYEDVFMDCDRSCATAPSSFCPMASCSPTVAVKLPYATTTPEIVRTPQAPGLDPNCAAQCPAGGYAYGLGFNIDTTYPDAFIVRVGSPWVVIRGSHSPYCPDANASVTARCAYFPTGSSGSFFVMTTDPNAPARNVSIQTAGSMSCP